MEYRLLLRTAPFSSMMWMMTCSALECPLSRVKSRLLMSDGKIYLHL